jgi:hypothetical protein
MLRLRSEDRFALLTASLCMTSRGGRNFDHQLGWSASAYAWTVDDCLEAGIGADRVVFRIDVDE